MEKLCCDKCGKETRCHSHEWLTFEVYSSLYGLDPSTKPVEDGPEYGAVTVWEFDKKTVYCKSCYDKLKSSTKK